MTHTVGEVARLAGITVRTLHHYDKIGLLSSSGRSDAGYRLYGATDIARLQQILVYRELGLPLADIVRVMNDPQFNRTNALRRQQSQLTAKAGQVRRMIKAIDDALAADKRGVTMDTEDVLEPFGDFDPAKHQKEAKERWGHTDAYQESARRTVQYTKEDWERLGVEAGKINQAFLALIEAGAPADSVEAMDVAERHRRHISRWFYDCTPEIHAALGEMYVQDARFTENIDKAGEGLAAFMSVSIVTNSRRSTD